MAEKLNLFIGGSLVQSGTKSWIEVLNPATQEVLCEAPCATDEEIEQAIAFAREAFLSWRETPPPERSRVMMNPKWLIGALSRSGVLDLMPRGSQSCTI